MKIAKAWGKAKSWEIEEESAWEEGR